MRLPWVKLNLEALEMRDCPSTTWTDANHASDDYWTDAGNWSNGLPGVGNPPVFDGSVTNNTCIVNTNTPTSMALTIKNGWHGTIEVASTNTFGFGNFTDSNPNTDSFNVKYLSSGSAGGSMDITGTAKFYNLNISDSGTNGYTKIDSTATVMMGDGSGWSINVVDEIDNYGTWYIGAYSGGLASTVFANDAVPKPWRNYGHIVVNGSTMASYKDAVSAGYTYIWNQKGANSDSIILTAGDNQEIDMPLFIEGGTVSIDTGTWTFKGELPYFGQSHTDTIYINGGTFNLGEPTTNAHNAAVFYDKGFEMGKDDTAGTAGTLNIWGPDNIDDNDYLVGITSTAYNYFTYGTINFNGYGQNLIVGTTNIGGGSGANGIVINMYAAATGGKYNDTIISTNSYGSGNVVIAGNSTIKTKIVLGDTLAKGTFTLINESVGNAKMQADFSIINLAGGSQHTDISPANPDYYWTYTF